MWACCQWLGFRGVSDLQQVSKQKGRCEPVASDWALGALVIYNRLVNKRGDVSLLPVTGLMGR